MPGFLARIGSDDDFVDDDIEELHHAMALLGYQRHICRNGLSYKLPQFEYVMQSEPRRCATDEEISQQMCRIAVTINKMKLKCLPVILVTTFNRLDTSHLSVDYAAITPEFYWLYSEG